MIKINLNDKGLPPEEEKRFSKLCDDSVTVTVQLGTAMVVETILKEVCDKIAMDAIQAVADGDERKAGVLATMGMEIVSMGKAINRAVASHANFNEIKSIAEKHKGSDDDEEDGTNPLSAFLAKRKDTLQ